MITTDLLRTINDRNASGQDRIEAIQLLREIRLEKKRQLQGQDRKILTLTELPGQETLRETMEDPENQVDVRCQAAAAATQTDNSSALKWCIEIIKQHVEQE
jgi:hypothetical protein